MEKIKKSKSVNDYRQELEEAIKNGLIKGSFKGNCFEIQNAYIENPILPIVILFIVLVVGIGAILHNNLIISSVYISIPCIVIICILIDSLLVIDFQNKTLYKVQRLLGSFQIYKTKPINFKDIKCIGTQNMPYGKSYNSKANQIVLVGKGPSEEELEKELTKCLSTNIVALVNSKIIYLTTPDSNEKIINNYNSIASFIAKLLDVPCKICERNQKVILGKDSTGKQTLVITPFFDEKEKNKIKTNQRNLVIILLVVFGGLFLLFYLASLFSNKPR